VVGVDDRERKEVQDRHHVQGRIQENQGVFDLKKTTWSGWVGRDAGLEGRGTLLVRLVSG